ncbi:MAG: WYL domain-containing protein, partial [Oscillospiraceae bacterium]|nr:WYL domain-containing protein [Oscillospiraceae bacterium]
MLFDEIYSAYFNAVAAILRSAADHPTDIREMRGIIDRYAFGESTVTIEQCIRDEKWQIITADGQTNIHHVPTMPLTILQKRWLKSVAADPRIRLFDTEIPDFPEVTPLFTADDYEVYDKYADGDPYEDENYIRIFRTVLSAARGGQTLTV